MKTQIKKFYYRDADRIAVAVDCIIFGFEKGSLQILLFKRMIEPFKDRGKLIGGFVDEGENLHSAARRVLHASTGLHNIYI